MAKNISMRINNVKINKAPRITTCELNKRIYNSYII